VPVTCSDAHFASLRYLQIFNSPPLLFKSSRINTYELCPITSALTPFKINTSGSVHSKALYPPLKSTLLKNRGGGYQLLLTRHATKHVYPERPSGAEGPLLNPARIPVLFTLKHEGRSNAKKDIASTFRRADVQTCFRASPAANPRCRPSCPRAGSTSAPAPESPSRSAGSPHSPVRPARDPSCPAGSGSS
jgi:hypothetical protein